MDFKDVKLSWLGHAAFRILWNGKVIYIDPFKIKTDEKADFIFVTHEHFDHCSIDDIKKIVKKTTIFVIPFDCMSKIRRFDCQMVVVHPDENKELGGFSFHTVPAYNVDKPFHEKLNEWVGYVISLGDIKIYHAGDTDFVADMVKLADLGIDVALLPVGGNYTMDYKEAAKAAEVIRPEVAIPMHYGTIVGTIEDAKNFKKTLEGKIKVEILEKEE